MEQVLIFAIVFFFLTLIGWVAYFHLKKKYESGEEIWNGRWLFSDTRIVKESDVKL